MVYLVEIASLTTNAKQEPVVSPWEAVMVVHAASFNDARDWLEDLCPVRQTAVKSIRLRRISNASQIVCDLPEYSAND